MGARCPQRPQIRSRDPVELGQVHGQILLQVWFIRYMNVFRLWANCVDGPSSLRSSSGQSLSLRFWPALSIVSVVGSNAARVVADVCPVVVRRLERRAPRRSTWMIRLRIITRRLRCHLLSISRRLLPRDRLRIGALKSRDSTRQLVRRNPNSTKMRCPRCPPGTMRELDEWRTTAARVRRTWRWNH